MIINGQAGLPRESWASVTNSSASACKLNLSLLSCLNVLALSASFRLRSNVCLFVSLVAPKVDKPYTLPFLALYLYTWLVLLKDDPCSLNPFIYGTPGHLLFFPTSLSTTSILSHLSLSGFFGFLTSTPDVKRASRPVICLCCPSCCLYSSTAYTHQCSKIIDHSLATWI